MKKIILFIILGCLAINSYEQVLNSVTPSSGQQGQLLNVSISGTNTHFLQATSTTLWFEQGSSTIILPASIQALNNAVISAAVQLSNQQPIGLYNLHLTNNLDGNLILNNSFTVVANPNLPHISSVSPNSASQGEILLVTISGQNTHFNQATGTTTWFRQGTSTAIYPNTQTSISATVLQANHFIPANASTGFYDTYTYNSTDGLLVFNSSFYIHSPSMYTVQTIASPLNGGSITGAGLYNNNQSCTITATNSPGFYFVNWTENGSTLSTNPSLTFIVNSNRNIIANFSPNNQFYISTIAMPVSSGTISGGGAYSLNQLATLHAIPLPGWYFASWLDNGNQVSIDSVYSFNVVSNRTLTALFYSLISVPEFENNNDILIYPNPAINYVRIDLKTDDYVLIEIYDALGKLVKTRISSREHSVKINTEDLNKGVYYVNVKLKNNINFSKKLLINK